MSGKAAAQEEDGVMGGPEIVVFERAAWDSGPGALVAGPDGQVWFGVTVVFDPGKVFRITTEGTVSGDFAVTRGVGQLVSLDGKVWFAQGDRIGYLTAGGVYNRFLLPGGLTQANRLVVGSDGGLWFNGGFDDVVGRMTTQGVFSLFDTGAEVGGMALGPDGNVWFALLGAAHQVGRITPQGVITTFAVPAEPRYIAAGPDGALWFTLLGGANNRIGRITTDGVMAIFSSPEVNVPTEITAGPDGWMWFVSSSNGRIGRISTDGVIEMVPDPDGEIFGPSGIGVGPDGNMWFTGFARVGRITVPQASLSVVKSAGQSEVVAGDDVDFTVEVTNTGGVALTGVEVSDPVAPACDELVGDLGVAESSTVACVYPTSETDIGVLENTATVDSVQTEPMVSNTVEVTVSAPSTTTTSSSTTTTSSSTTTTTTAPPPLLCDGAVVTVDLNEGEVASVGDDVINGTPGDDRVDGLGGDDRFCGRGGDDVFVGGWGADRVFGGPGDDRLWGRAGRDVLVGRSGADVLRGGDGRDWLLGQDDDDVLVGGNGRDGLDGGAGDDRCDGRAGVDHATGCEVLSGVP